VVITSEQIPRKARYDTRGVNSGINAGIVENGY
jgi:hypothetical protein